LSTLIDFTFYPLRAVLPVLLQDKTTKRNIIWATDAYAENGDGFLDKQEIRAAKLMNYPKLIKPRIEKTLEDQQDRTRKKAEVFTPAWLCNHMNNYCDESWFGRKNVFNIENSDHTWDVVQKKIEFPEGKNWEKYVDSRRLEITCGEGPFLVSRYDAATGQLIEPPKRRIGILDRKLRIVNENTESYEDWLKWTTRAFEATYGFEYQGDSLLLARTNLLVTFIDYYFERWQKLPDTKELSAIANIIAWNLWQMDGFTDMVPLGKQLFTLEEPNLFAMIEPDEPIEQNSKMHSSCKVHNWRAKYTAEINKLKNKERREMFMKKGHLFSVILGNPPYQSGDNQSNSRQDPIYPLFYDAAEKLADEYILISPARFLFNAGLTSKKWNQKMLSDPHLKVEDYVPDGTDVFPNTDIKGG